MKPERVVLDTNVLISGLLSTTSAPASAIDHAITSGQLIASADTLRELMSKLLSPTFDPYVTRERRDALLVRLAPPSQIVEIVQTVRMCRDPTDDKFLEAAVNGRADVIVGWRPRPARTEPLSRDRDPVAYCLPPSANMIRSAVPLLPTAL
jgi:putative PIN family toxin of toxin-antitoxin system